MSGIGVGWHCGIGNFIVATTAMQALADIAGHPIDLIFDASWKGSDRDSIEMMAKRMSFINKIVDYFPGDTLNQYDHVYMSRHSTLTSSLYQRLYGNMAKELPKLPMWAASYQHERDYYLSEIEALLGTRARIFPQFVPIANSFPFEISDKPYIVIANGWKRTKGAFWERKCWPHFGEFVNVFLSYYPEFDVCIVGGEEDQIWSKNLEIFPDFLVKNRVHDFTGRLNILETAYLISRAKLVVSNDSVVGHFSDCLKKQGITLWGPTLVSKNGALNETIENVRSSLKCAPCQGTHLGMICDDWERCMAEIPVGLIMAVVKKLLT